MKSKLNMVHFCMNFQGMKFFGSKCAGVAFMISLNRFFSIQQHVFFFVDVFGFYIFGKFSLFLFMNVIFN